jgi:hypothetical protein
MIGARLIVAIIVGCAVCIAAPCLAEPISADRATAEALFREAKRLMLQRSFAEACPKLEESQRLDPQGGTLLNLAVCHAREGKTASAWTEFQEALALAREAKRNDRIRLARSELAQLSLRLSHLVIEVPPEARVPGLEVRRGAVAVPEAAFGVAVPVDPGEFTITARAPHHRPWQTSVNVAETDRASVAVPALEPLPPPTKRAAKPKPPPPPRQDSGRTQRVAGYVVGGAGIVALAVGGVFGWRAIDRANQSEEHCDGSLCSPRGLELNDDADRAATIANVAGGIGILGVGIGTYLVLAAPSPDEPGLRASAAIGAERGAVLISGAW